MLKVYKIMAIFGKIKSKQRLSYALKLYVTCSLLNDVAHVAREYKIKTDFEIISRKAKGETKREA
jgi:hypothetical protein